MNKPNPMGAKSLEEILASIRKSLAEDGTSRPGEPQIAPARTPQPEAKPASPANAAAKGAGALSGKIAGALNGAAVADDDLKDLLAAEPRKSAPSTTPIPAKAPTAANPAEAGGSDDKDPLWFLTRLSAAAAAGNGTRVSAARARDAAKAPSSEEVKLSRPEDLRASLPPLFGGGGAEPAPGDRASAEPAPTQEKAAGVVSLTLRTEPRIAPSQSVSERVTAKSAPGTPSAVGAARETFLEAPPPVAPTLPSARDGAKAGASEAPFGAKPPASDSPATLAMATAATVPIEVEGLGAVVPQRALLRTDPALSAVDPLPGPTLPTRALEQVLAEVLEPAVRQWLQSQLPRLIESVVREEVARAVAAEREVSKA